MKHVELPTIVHHVSKFSPEVGRGGGFIAFHLRVACRVYESLCYGWRVRFRRVCPACHLNRGRGGNP